MDFDHTCVAADCFEHVCVISVFLKEAKTVNEPCL